MIKSLLTSIALSLATAGSLCAQDAPGGVIERGVLRHLTAVAQSGKLAIHYESNRWMKRLIEHYVADEAAALADLEKRLGMQYRGTIHVFVYIDAGKMARHTGAQGAGAYAAGNCIHTPFHLYPHHELTHVLCLQWNAKQRVPEDKQAADYGTPLGKFVVEGFAEAMTEVGWGRIPMREWVALYDRLGWVPPFAELLAKFPATGTRAQGYWIAGSFFTFLIEKYGMKRVKKFYFRPNEPKAAFGKELASLEEAWRAWLAETPLDVEKLAMRLGPEAYVFERRVKGKKGRAALTVTADDMFILMHDDEIVGGGASWMAPQRFERVFTGDDRLRVIVINGGGAGGLLLEATPAGKKKPWLVSDAKWRVHAAGAGERRPKPVAVLGAALSGAWGQFATDAAKKALGAMRGSWIWRSTQ